MSEVHIVCYKEYAHGPKIFNESKVFRDKQNAEEYSRERTEIERKRDSDPATYWMVVTKEIEEER